MKKIKTLFKRNFETHLVENEIEKGVEWVANGEGVATRKYDGQCCAIIDGIFYKRREIKPDQSRPADYIEEELDETTRKSFGWVPVKEGSSDDKYFNEAYKNLADKSNGTYELLGKGSQGDIEKLGNSTMLKHSNAEIYPDCPRDYEGLKNWLRDKDIEGVVFHHPDGRMSKIKKKDFGLKRANNKQ